MLQHVFVMREYSTVLREFCSFVCLDNKHKIKIREPNYPVAATERGRRVPVSWVLNFTNFMFYQKNTKLNTSENDYAHTIDVALMQIRENFSPQIHFRAQFAKFYTREIYPLYGNYL